MKKIILVLLSLVLFSFTEEVLPIACNAQNGYKFEPSDTADHEVQFCDIPIRTEKTLYLEMASTNTDSIAFASGISVNSSHGKFGPGQKVPFTIINGLSGSTGGNLHYKCDLADEEFKVTF